MVPAPYEDAEKNFPRWLSKLLPSVDCEDWRELSWSRLCDKYPNQRELIKRWKKKENFSPDYKIVWKKRHQYLCWVDVKWTPKVKDTFNLNWKKRDRYLLVSWDTKLPVYIVVFTGAPCRSSPSKWGCVARRISRIPLKDTKSLISEIKKLMRIKNAGHKSKINSPERSTCPAG